MKKVKLSEMSFADLVALQTYHQWLFESQSVNYHEIDKVQEKVKLTDEQIKKRISEIDFTK